MGSPVKLHKTFKGNVRLQNSRIFWERKRRGKYSNERSGPSVGTAREIGEKLRTCEARALHTRGSR